jgi:hypothetical protein
LAHVPQFELLFVGSTHALPQLICPAGHALCPPLPAAAPALPATLGRVLLLPDAEHAAGNAAPKHNSRNSPTDLVMAYSGARSAGCTFFKPSQSWLPAPNRQRKTAIA